MSVATDLQSAVATTPPIKNRRPQSHNSHYFEILQNISLDKDGNCRPPAAPPISTKSHLFLDSA
jgi:hypothetical protein